MSNDYISVSNSETFATIDEVFEKVFSSKNPLPMKGYFEPLPSFAGTELAGHHIWFPKFAKTKNGNFIPAVDTVPPLAKILSMLFFFLLLASPNLVSCSSDDDYLNEKGNQFEGTWVSQEGYIAIFEEDIWYIPEYSEGRGIRGTYTYVDNTASIIYTEITEDGIIWRSITPNEAQGYTRIAKVSGNTLTWGMTTYKRKL